MKNQFTLPPKLSIQAVLGDRELGIWADTWVSKAKDQSVWWDPSGDQFIRDYPISAVLL